jgi:pyrroline-5-carboxylate reductase
MIGKIGIIGAGNMGTAIVRGLVAATLVPADDITAFDIDETKLRGLATDPGVKAAPDLAALAGGCDTIIIAVKPQSMTELLRDLARHVSGSHLVISIAAGISTVFLEQRLPPHTRVVRVMPNTPAMVRTGATALCRGSQATAEDMALATRLFCALGTTVTVREELMDAVTALSGSGPAYFFYLAEKLRDAAVAHGLPEKEADELVRQTLFGAGKLLRETHATPEELRGRVTSKGGTTAAAVAVFDEADLSGIVSRAIAAAVARSKELGM